MSDHVAFVESLVGRGLETVTGRPNRILRIEGDVLAVATSRSPCGREVPLEWVLDALRRLHHDREVEVSVESLGYRSAFVGAVLQAVPGAVVLSTVPPRVRLGR